MADKPPPPEKDSSQGFFVDAAQPPKYSAPPYPPPTTDDKKKIPYHDSTDDTSAPEVSNSSTSAPAIDRDGKIPSSSEDAPPSYFAPPIDSTHLQGQLAFNMNAPRFTFHIYRDSLFNQDLTIMTDDHSPSQSSSSHTGNPDKSQKKSVAFSVRVGPTTSVFGTGPHINVFRGPSNLQSASHPIGAVTFNRAPNGPLWAWGMDFRFHGRPPIAMLPQTIQPPGVNVGPVRAFLRTGYVYPSPAPGVGLVAWRREGANGITLRTVPGDLELARYDTRQSIDKRGVLQICEGGLGDPWIDEVVTTAVAYVDMVRRRR